MSAASRTGERQDFPKGNGERLAASMKNAASQLARGTGRTILRKTTVTSLVWCGKPGAELPAPGPCQASSVASSGCSARSRITRRDLRRAALFLWMTPFVTARSNWLIA